MPKTCSVKGCTKPHRAYGLCRVHYARWYRNGSVERTQRDYNDGRPLLAHAVEKLLAQITKTDNGCWIYGGPSRSGHYGDVAICRGDSGKFRWSAHRLSYEHFKGPIPDGLLVCHTCDNRKCTNPEHLFLGTHQVNSADMARKGRSRHGERANNVKLSHEDIPQIYRMRDEGLTYREIGEKFGVTYGCIHMICVGRNWHRSYQQFRARDSGSMQGNIPRRVSPTSSTVNLAASRRKPGMKTA